MNKNILLIGGLDPSGCAGIAADLKTCMAWDAYGLPVITVVTAQNTQGVSAIEPVPLKTIQAQVESIVSDIEIHAVKIGLLGSSRILNLVVSLCREYALPNIVVDPVLRSTTGYDFFDSGLVRNYIEKLFPVADVITPNIDEATLFSAIEVKDLPSMKEAAIKLHRSGAKNVVITGGHLPESAIDLLYDGSRHQVFEAKKVTNTNARGLGCTFASIVAVHVARKESIPSAITAAKEFIAKAMVHPFRIGKGRGPLNHKVKI
jgi:hydroxymethylpyrimidine/phosphomethylpyrimidine kinase